jgi:cytoskeletal protein CcmA (bactofilin family)
MWKREGRRLPTNAAESPAASAQGPTEPTAAAPFGFDQTQGGQRTMNEERSNGKGFLVSEDRASIGKSIVVKGELSGGEDLTIEGTVEGKIELRDHVLTVGENGHIKAEVSAKSIVVFGHVVGNLTATEKVDIKEKGSVEGDITAPRVAIDDGSNFKGSVDMPRREQTWSADRAGSSRDNHHFVRV